MMPSTSLATLTAKAGSIEMAKSVAVTLKICVEIDDEYMPSDHIENIFEVTRKTFPLANVELLDSDISGTSDAEWEP